MQQEHIPPCMYVPRDEDDPTYVISFPPDRLDAAKEFFEEFGFAVVRDVLTPAECEATTSEMWDLVESTTPGLDRRDASTWKLWKCRAFGMPSRDPVMTPQVVQNRQNRVVYDVFRTLCEEDELLVNHDRWGLMRPTKVEPGWGTKDNLHLDMNPWKYAHDDRSLWDEIGKRGYVSSFEFIKENNAVTHSFGRNVQAVINLMDNREEDGGTQVVPGFHLHFERWLASKGSMPQDASSALSHSFPKHSRINSLGVRIPMRAGSMIAWDQRCAHGSKGNNSENLRMVQFVKMFSAKTVDAARLQIRGLAVRRYLEESGVAATEVGDQVFGLKYISKVHSALS